MDEISYSSKPAKLALISAFLFSIFRIQVFQKKNAILPSKQIAMLNVYYMKNQIAMEKMDELSWDPEIINQFTVVLGITK